MKVTKDFKVDYAHRLLEHPGKCHNLHGHTAKISITLEGVIDKISGMVMDFGDIKTLIEPIINVYDHAVVLNKEDPLVEALLKAFATDVIVLCGEPTAENLAKTIAIDTIKVLKQVEPKLVRHPVTVCRVAFYETADNYAIWEARI